jgi:hypothetical protein
VTDQHEDFRRAVRDSRLQDPTAMFANLAQFTGISVEDLEHHALVRWASAGGEALMSMEPQTLRELQAACARRDWSTVAGIVDWLVAGWDGTPTLPG